MKASFWFNFFLEVHQSFLNVLIFKAFLQGMEKLVSEAPDPEETNYQELDIPFRNAVDARVAFQRIFDEAIQSAMIFLAHIFLLCQQGLGFLGRISSLQVQILKVKLIFFKEIMDNVPSKRVNGWSFIALNERDHLLNDGKVNILIVDQ